MTTWVGDSELRAQVPAAFFETATLLPIQVMNPTPGGGISAVRHLEVTSRSPVYYVHIDGGGHLWTGEVRALTARAVDVHDRPVHGHAVTWVSSDANRATVDATGRVTMRAPGNVEIRATVDGFTQKTLVIGVEPPALDLLFDDGLTIYRTSLGTNRPVTRVVEGGTDAALSPDGTRLAFVRATPEGGTDILGGTRGREPAGASHERRRG